MMAGHEDGWTDKIEHEHCDTCAHWQSWFGPDESTPPPGYGRCGRIEPWPRKGTGSYIGQPKPDPASGPIVNNDDDPYVSVSLDTPPDFSCNLWEERKD